MAYPQSTFHHTKLAPGSFCARKRQVVRETTLLYQLKVLKQTGRYDAFKLDTSQDYYKEPETWPIPQHLFWDSDIAKWLEGACYFMRDSKNDKVDAAVKDLVKMIAAAQQPDGYINVHFTTCTPEARFSNVRDLHELYNAGHMIEAAIAHHQVYGNNDFLGPMLRYVDLLCKIFGPDGNQLHGYPGHPEIELALLRLHSITNDQKHLDLGRYFIEERGNPKGVVGMHYYDWEAKRRGERPGERPDCFPTRRSYWYQQAHQPIMEQETIRGHSVRAMYLLTATADLMRKPKSESGKDYMEALRRLWKNMVEKKMYMTGGIGAEGQWEGFGIDYYLPQSFDEGGCYAETCASIGVMMLAERLLQIDLDGQYADIMELCLYNAVLTGMSCDGKQFTYVNSLASSTGNLSKREEWFTCACCPPNLTRLLGYIGGSFWTFESHESTKSAYIKVHLFGSATLSFPVGQGNTVELTQTSNWPWDGEIAFDLKGTANISTTIDVRIPGWASDWKITPEPPQLQVTKHYLHLPADWLRENSQFKIQIPLKVRFMRPHPYTNQDTVTLARGPIVYCLEDVDNPWVEDHFKSLLFDPSIAEIQETSKKDEATGESYLMLTAKNAASLLNISDTTSSGPPTDAIGTGAGKKVGDLHFVPFYFRANRPGKGHMRVGLRRRR